MSSDQSDTVKNESPREQMSRGVALVQDAFDAQYDEMKKELDHWKVEYAQQKHRANDAEKELKESKSRIAELEQRLEESKEAHNTLFRKYYETKTEQEKLKQFKDSITSLLGNAKDSDTLSTAAHNSESSEHWRQNHQELINNLRETISRSPTKRQSPIRQTSPLIHQRSSPLARSSPLTNSSRTSTPERRFNTSNIGHEKYDQDLTVSDLLSTRSRPSPRIPKPSPTRLGRSISPASSYLLMDRDISSFSRGNNSFLDQQSTETDAIEAEDLYRRVKSRLTKDQFKQFAVNIKLLNTGTQSSIETLKNLEVVFRNDRELYNELRKLIDRNGSS